LENKKEILKDYVCEYPFSYSDIHTHGQFVCCPAWGPPNLKVDEDGTPNSKLFNETDDVQRNWTSKNAFDIRKGVYDGSYRLCNTELCPKLNQIINSGIVPTHFLKKEEFEEKYDIKSIEDIKNFKKPPEEILFGFDRSCNLKCPSCRVNLVPNDDIDSYEYKNKMHLVKSIEENYGSNLRRILVTGSGDPFYSNVYRKYLQEFDISKYPKLEWIMIITNGIILNRKMWNSLKAAPHIKVIEVSIDAGTKETYENVTRLNGQWDVLMENLDFIATLTHLNDVTCSMVVSKNNYKEMELFYDLITEKFKNYNSGLCINYRQIVNWGTYSTDEMNNLQVFSKDNELNQAFIKELKKIHGRPFVNHNFHHLLS